MASTFSTRLRLENIGDGEQSGSWGQTTDHNICTLVEEAISGVSSVTHDDSATYTLTAFNAVTDESRRMVLKVGGTLTANRNIEIPSSEKLYVVHNNTSGGFDLTIKTSGGTGAVVKPGTGIVYCDGTDCFQVVTGEETVASTNETITGDWTFSGSLAATGTFTSVGIDDNATATRVVVADGLTSFGANDTTVYPLTKNTANTGGLAISGGNSATAGGNIQLYGGAHATKAGDVEIRADSTVVAGWDESANLFTVSGDLTSTGTYTSFASTGIDDNATSTALTITDGSLQLTPATNVYAIITDSTNDSITLAAGTSASSGANIRMFGSAHATLASDIELRTGTTVRVRYDFSGTVWDFNTESLNNITNITLGGAVGVTSNGTPGAPAYQVDSDGAGGGTGIYGSNTGTSDELNIAIDGIESAAFAATSVQLGHATADEYSMVRRGSSTGGIEIAGGSASGSGGQVKVYGGSHATKGGDIEFGTTGVNKLVYDHSLGRWEASVALRMTGAAIVGVEGTGGPTTPTISLDADGAGSGTGIYGLNTASGYVRSTVNGAISTSAEPSSLVLHTAGTEYTVTRDATNGYMGLSGGNSLTTGGVILLYGSTSSNAYDIILRSGATSRLWWDHSSAYWTVQENPIVKCPTVPRAWVNFDSAGTISSDYNVSTITDHGTGQWTVNFTTALPSALYAVVGSVRKSGTSDRVQAVMVDNATAPTTSACRLRVGGSETSITVDPTQIYVAMLDD